MELPADLIPNVTLQNQTDGVDGNPIPGRYTLSHSQTELWMNLDYYPAWALSQYKLQWRSRLPLKDIAEILRDVDGQPTDGRKPVGDVIEVVRIEYPDHNLAVQQSPMDEDKRVISIQALDAPIFIWGALDLLRRSVPELSDPSGVLQDIELGRLAVIADYRNQSSR
jgi:hypothetical protein